MWLLEGLVGLAQAVQIVAHGATELKFKLSGPLP
ncbi:MAG: hypothetical protein CM15mP21_4290 [Hyphomicrobiales bacterium]|nr:MAG: hypothetical protein CM15mP21_4290 [Hyphomicrobiales bacterium]